jgi:hypothetical protein
MISALLGALALDAVSARANEASVVDGQLRVVVDDGQGDVIDIWPEGLAHEVYSQGGIDARSGCRAFTADWVRCDAQATKIVVDGGPGDDMIGAWDVHVPVEMRGGVGDDLLESGGAVDLLLGGDGVDALVAGDGDDVLAGGADDDFLEGQGAGDQLTGDSGDDVLVAGDSTGDRLLGDDGADLLRGGTGDGFLGGGAGDDTLVSGSGADELDPGSGTNTIFGVVAGDDVNCSSNDRARTRAGKRVKGCAPLPPSVSKPRAWPPRSQAASTATVRPNDPGIHSWVRRPGRATRYSVDVDSGRTKYIKSCIRLYDFPGDRIKKFSKRVRVRHKKSYTEPNIPASSHYVSVARKKCK